MGESSPGTVPKLCPLSAAIVPHYLGRPDLTAYGETREA